MSKGSIKLTSPNGSIFCFAIWGLFEPNRQLLIDFDANDLARAKTSVNHQKAEKSDSLYDWVLLGNQNCSTSHNWTSD